MSDDDERLVDQHRFCAGDDGRGRRRAFLLKDENGGMAMITIKDVYQSNGVIQVVDHVLLPKMRPNILKIK